jgi:hypothetical protein
MVLVFCLKLKLDGCKPSKIEARLWSEHPKSKLDALDSILDEDEASNIESMASDISNIEYGEGNETTKQCRP